MPPSRRARTPRPTKTDRAHACDGAVAYRCWGRSIASNGLTVRDAGTILALVNAIRPISSSSSAVACYVGIRPRYWAGTGTIGPPQVPPLESSLPEPSCQAVPNRRSQQLLGEQHECSQTARNGIPLRGASEFSGGSQIVPCVTAQLAMQELGSHTRTRVTKTSHIAV